MTLVIFFSCINKVEFVGQGCAYTYTDRKCICKKDASNDLCCTGILVVKLVFLVSCFIIPQFTDMSILATGLQSTSPYESVVTDEQRKKDKHIS